MNLVQANRCIKLAEFLENLPDEKFDFNLIREEEYELLVKNNKVKLECKTVACAMGWCPEVFPDKFESKIDENYSDGMNVNVICDIKLKNSEKFNEVAAAQFFGLSQEMSEKIFLGSHYDFYKDLNGYVKKEDVANALYKVVKDAGYEIV